jgi:hypothetical protein
VNGPRMAQMRRRCLSICGQTVAVSDLNAGLSLGILMNPSSFSQPLDISCTAKLKVESPCNLYSSGAGQKRQPCPLGRAAGGVHTHNFVLASCS